MTDLKAWASRRLREAFAENADRDRWTQHGSTRPTLGIRPPWRKRSPMYLTSKANRWNGSMAAQDQPSRKRENGSLRNPSLTLPARMPFTSRKTPPAVSGESSAARATGASPPQSARLTPSRLSNTSMLQVHSQCPPGGKVRTRPCCRSKLRKFG